MAKANPEIFRAYDIRGIYGTDFDEQFAEELGNRLAAFLGVKTIVLGRDARTSSEPLARAVERGIRAAGTDVLLVGPCTTPLFYYPMVSGRAQGGIMVTASHNEGDFNGFKAHGPGGAMIGGAQLKTIYETTGPQVAEHPGEAGTEDVADAYADHVVRSAGFERTTGEIGVKGPAPLTPILDAISRRTGLTFVPGKQDGLAVEFDDDADRIFITEEGGRMEPEMVFCVLAQAIGAKRVVCDLRFSRSALEWLDQMGIERLTSKAGRFFIHETMKAHDADLGGEVTGHYQIKRFGFLESPEFALLTLLKAIRAQGTTLNALIMPHRAWANSGEIKYPLNPQAFAVLHSAYSDGEISMLDGIKVDYPDWWFIIRPSNTEPVMKLIVEAKTKDLLEQRIQEISMALSPQGT